MLIIVSSLYSHIGLCCKYSEPWNLNRRKLEIPSNTQFKTFLITSMDNVVAPGLFAKSMVQKHGLGQIHPVPQIVLQDRRIGLTEIPIRFEIR